MFVTFRFFNRQGKSRRIHPSSSVILKSKVQTIHMEEWRIKSDMHNRNHKEKDSIVTTKILGDYQVINVKTI